MSATNQSIPTRTPVRCPASHRSTASGRHNSARQEPDGTYVSAVLPGPGAVFVRVRNANQYMPACVDPKAFFKDTPSAGLEGMAFGDRTLLYITAGADGGAGDAARPVHRNHPG